MISSDFFFILSTRQLFEDREHVQHQSPFGTIANFFGPNDHRYHQVLLHLHVGALCLWMRYESAAMVLRRYGTKSVLLTT